MLDEKVYLMKSTKKSFDRFYGFRNGKNHQFILKMLIVWLAATLIGSIFPRFKVEEGVLFYWKWPLFAALFQAVVIIF